MPDITRAAIMNVAHAEELDRYAGGATLPRDAARHLAEALQAWERSCDGQARWRARLAPQSVLAGFARWRSRLARPTWLPRLLRIRRTAAGEHG
jgi:hypothetical protein